MKLPADATPSEILLHYARAAWRQLYWMLVEAPRFIRPTLEGVFFIAFTLAVGFAAMNTGAQLLYVMFSLMCGFLVLSAVLATRNIVGLRVRREAPRLADAGRPFRVALWLENRKRLLPTFSIRLHDELESGGRVGAAFADGVPARGVAEEPYWLVFPRRGLVRFAGIRLGTRFPFGLIERRFSVPAPWEVLVLPQVVDVSYSMAQALPELGERPLNRRGHGLGLYNIRPHVPGDNSRDIHWKTTARRGQLMVREYESEERRQAVVLLDEAVPPGGEEDAALRGEFEHAVVLAASVCAWLARNDYDFELRTRGGRSGLGEGDRHLQRCRRLLARIELAGTAAEGTRPPAPPQSRAAAVAIGWRHGAPRGAGGAYVLHVDDFRSEIDSALNHPAEESALFELPATEERP
ncbi:MAG: DUF58 domain-containing protein [Candidatus Sumerlaeia bacterium]|nr:DUF58 domain-containing protein [Candidatus Sumerlaeia bacterium]